MTPDPFAKAESIILAAALAVAGLCTAAGICWQWVGQQIDRAVVWR